MTESKALVLKHARNIDNTDFENKRGVSEQFPLEFVKRQTQLRPQYIEAKKHHQDVKWAGDKIIVNKRVIKVPKDKTRNINYIMEDKAAQKRTINTPPRCYDGSTFQGHCMRLESQDDVVAGLHAVRKATRVARADHNIYAYYAPLGKGQMGTSVNIMKMTGNMEVADGY